ncbi:bicaudal C homolog 2 [Triplophysa rosa]|uniref:Bicaudal C-like protein 2 n=1 Tax=Triplophysa rosa TaxID=992332 RepID=A0A9W7TM95_TRIRA|nr:bicaudal C homolog 2 [Triplophysa rosa]KAI7801568.1 bicaudal C-like protein 2 [Triplophysa rosa]
MASPETCSTVETLQSESPKQEPDQNQDQDPAFQNQNGRDDDEEEDEGVSSGAEAELQNQEHLDSEWVEESFRIDRKKLELMLYGPAEGSGPTGDEFFERVMRETGTQVKWPSKLKIGAKSKKDPHVKVEGKRANVLEAKQKILELLETKVNKVTLKMDVSHTEHSHVIGKGGGNIKKVMEETSCHIHFPDSNRNSVTGEKSNQVSIAGPVEGVESARTHIRALQPLVLTFDLPVTLMGGAVADTGSPVIQHVAQAFGVSVSFRTQPKIYCNTCVVRGTQGNSAAVKKAKCALMELLLGPEAVAGVTGVVVSTQLDVTSQQHLFLLGQNGVNFLTVMHQTHTQIILPDLSAPQHTPSLMIQGTADGVCVARQQLMDCLPVCLMFDMKDEGESDPRKLAQMMQNLGVFISIKPKVKQTAKSVVLKGLERNIANLYKARSLLLGLDSSEVSKTTKPPVDPLVANNGMTGYWLNILMQQLRLTETAAAVSSISGKPRPSPPPGLAVSSEDGRIGLKGTDSKLEKIPENEGQLTNGEMENCVTPHAEVREVVVKPAASSRRGSQSDTPRDLKQSLTSESSHRSVRAEVDGVYLNRDRRCSLRVFSSMDSNNEDQEYERKKLLANQAMQQTPVVTEVRTPTDTWSGLGFSKSMPAEAVKELRAVNRRCYRPYQQQSWISPSGNGSHSENWRERRGSLSSSPPDLSSSSSSFQSHRFSTARTLESYLTSTNHSEGGSAVPRHLIGRSPSPTHTDDLEELLARLGLAKYIDIFQEQEIDFQTFLTLTDEDLKEVGVSTFGARRKMILTITDLSKRRKCPETASVKSGYLEGGASGRLPRIMDEDVAAKSIRW